MYVWMYVCSVISNVFVNITTVGMVLGYAIGYAYSTTAAGWRSVYGWSSVLAVVMCIGM